MTILTEIQRWAAGQPVWQQHAVAVLYERPALTAADLEDILKLLKRSKGIGDSEDYAARVLTVEQVAVPPSDEAVGHAARQAGAGRTPSEGRRPGGNKPQALEVYDELRKAWERGVEEVLFNQVVVRFRRGVETLRLKKVAVEPEDLKAINAGMSRCSTYTGHDGALDANVAPASPEEMDADINALEEWRKSAVQRSEKR